MECPISLILGAPARTVDEEGRKRPLKYLAMK